MLTLGLLHHSGLQAVTILGRISILDKSVGTLMESWNGQRPINFQLIAPYLLQSRQVLKVLIRPPSTHRQISESLLLFSLTSFH